MYLLKRPADLVRHNYAWRNLWAGWKPLHATDYNNFWQGLLFQSSVREMENFPYAHCSIMRGLRFPCFSIRTGSLFDPVSTPHTEDSWIDIWVPVLLLFCRCLACCCISYPITTSNAWMLLVALRYNTVLEQWNGCIAVCCDKI